MIKIVSTEQFAFPVIGAEQRFIHLATILYNSGRGKVIKYWYFVDRITQKRYCQEEGFGELPPENLMLEIEALLALEKIDQTIVTPSNEYLVRKPVK